MRRSDNMHIRLISSIPKVAFGAATFIVIGSITAKASKDALLHGLQARPKHSIIDHDTALAKITQIRAYEKTLNLHTGCQTTVLTHGHKVKHVIILMHGMTNCPLQYAELSHLLYERGYNVLIPRMPHNGLADVETTDLQYLTAKELCDCSATMVDIAHGLGERVTYAGISAGGTMAAWVVQYRADVDRAILIAPAFTIDPKLEVSVSLFAMCLLYLLPNIMTQHLRSYNGPPHGYRGFATRGLAAMMRLGFSIYAVALKTRPAVQSVLVVTNAADPAVNNTITHSLVNRWQKNGLRYCEMYKFDARHHLLHDIIDPQQPQQQTAFVYPILLDLITHNQDVEMIAQDKDDQLS